VRLFFCVKFAHGFYGLNGFYAGFIILFNPIICGKRIYYLKEKIITQIVVYSLLFILCSLFLFFILYSLLFILYSLLFTLYSLLFTLYSLLFVPEKIINSEPQYLKKQYICITNYVIDYIWNFLIKWERLL
jgi:hypothetical protein